MLVAWQDVAEVYQARHDYRASFGTRRSSRLRRDHHDKIKMEYVVYILLSKKTLRYYVGQTHNIKERFKRHNCGFVPSTKSGLPWELILTIDVKNRSEALKLEKRIKKRGIKRFLDDNQFGV